MSRRVVPSPEPAVEVRAAEPDARGAAAGGGLRLIVPAAIAVVGGVLGALPLMLATLGVIELAALVQHRWDPTWNDGDPGISAGGAVVLLVLLGATGAAAAAVGPVARASRRAIVVATVLGALGVAAAAWGALTLLRS